MKTLKKYLPFLLLSGLLLQCASSRTIDQIESPLEEDDGIIIGKMIMVKSTNQTVNLPSFTITDMNRKDVFQLDNTSFKVLRPAKKELIFIVSVPAGTYTLDRFWWGNTNDGFFESPNTIEVKPKTINYAGDIVVRFERSPGFLKANVTAEHEIVSNMGSVHSAVRDKLSNVDWPVEESLIH